MEVIEIILRQASTLQPSPIFAINLGLQSVSIAAVPDLCFGLVARVPALEFLGLGLYLLVPLVRPVG